MSIENLINSLPGQWAIIALIAGIGLAVVFLRGLIKIAVRIFLIGTIGFILLAAVYLIFNYAHISL